jgi:hypothetical protein
MKYWIVARDMEIGSVEKTDHKFFDKLNTAKAWYDKWCPSASETHHLGKDKQADVYAVRLYEVDVPKEQLARDLVNLVKEGQPVLLKDSVQEEKARKAEVDAWFEEILCNEELLGPRLRGGDGAS